MKVSRDQAALAFAWHDRHVFSFVLPVFLVASFMLHAGAFYVLQVKSPPSATTIPPPVRISVLLPTPENEKVLGWIASEDPAVGLAPEPLPFGELLEVPYKASFADGRAQPRVSEPPAATVPYPPAQRSSDLIATVLGQALAEPETRRSFPTTYLFSPELPPLQAHASEGVPPRRRSTTPAGATRYLIGVNSEGRVQFVFLQSSGGSDLLDAEGEWQLQQRRFEPGSGEIKWGFATITWGSDAFEPAPAANP